MVSVQPQFLEVRQELDGIRKDVQLIGSQIKLDQRGDGAQVVRDRHQQVLPALQVQQAAQPGGMYKYYYLYVSLLFKIYCTFVIYFNKMLYESLL